MAGNTWEWVQDWFHSDYTGAPTDGSAWEVPTRTSRVIRGGGLGHAAVALRAVNREPNGPSAQFDYLSFRCAKDVL
jgi:formylglycine-generating enzyme required for sulfatase activity